MINDLYLALNLGIDDMDQKKTCVPKPLRSTKSLSGLLPLKTHVTGVIITNGLLESHKDVLLFANADQFKQGIIQFLIIIFMNSLTQF